MTGVFIRRGKLNSQLIFDKGAKNTQQGKDSLTIEINRVGKTS